MKKIFIISLAMTLWLNITYAWQLQNKTIEECVKEASLVITGRTIKIISTEESEIAGFGLSRKIKLKVLKILKGNLDQKEIIVFLSDNQIDSFSFDPNREYIWFISNITTKDIYWNGKIVELNEEHYITIGNYTCIFSKEMEDEISQIIQNP